MISGDFDWKTGKVVFWDLDTIDESRPLADQNEHLKEDLAQIEFPAGVVLDVGWYPEFAATGNFVVCVVQQGDWERPLFRKDAVTTENLRARLVEGIRIAVRRDAVVVDQTQIRVAQARHGPELLLEAQVLVFPAGGVAHDLEGDLLAGRGVRRVIHRAQPALAEAAQYREAFVSSRVHPPGRSSCPSSGARSLVVPDSASQGTSPGSPKGTKARSRTGGRRN